MKSLFTVIFKDLTTYRGGDYSNSGWLDIPNKPIKRIIYQLPNGDSLVLNGYDSYFHMTEAVTDLSGKKRGRTKLEFDYIMGKKNGIITYYKISLINGNIDKRVYREDTKEMQKLNKIGWK